MTKQEFIHNSSHYIFKEVAKSVNQLCGLSKTSSMIANLFTNLPIKVEARFIESQPKPSKKLNALDQFVHAYIKHDDSSTVYIAFFYSSEKQFKRITKAIEKHPEFFTLLYMREALKLVRLMNTKTHYNIMSGIIKHNAPATSVESYYRLSQNACNYVVNSVIKQLFIGSPLSIKIDRILEGQQYDSKYSKMSEMDVLKKLLNGDPSDVPAITKLDEQFSYDELSNTVFDCTNGPIETDESIQTDLGESISTQLAQMSRDSGSASIFSEFFAAKKVKTGWFKKLAAKFSREVYHMTNTFTSQWSSLNITYRKKFKAPNAKYEDNKLSVVLSVDHSGSVSTDGLQKLLYLFEKHSKKITQLFVLVHDTQVVKQFQIESDFDIKSNPQFVEALAHRFAVGGTSHYDVFSKINTMLEEKVIDPEKSIYISFSDNYSDIPNSWAAFPKLHKLSTTFLSPVNNPVNLPRCTDITMQ
jgi:hypothetical protein